MIALVKFTVGPICHRPGDQSHHVRPMLHGAASSQTSLSSLLVFLLLATAWTNSGSRGHGRLASRPLHDQRDRAIDHPRQIVQGVFDVFAFPELARPAPTRELASRMGWLAEKGE
jgi:hypothetical protein